MRDRNNMPGIPQMSMQVLWGKSHTQAVPSIWESTTSCGKMGHFKKVCMSKKNCAVHEVEVMPEPQVEDIETVSINLIYLNRNQLLITAHLKMQVGKTITEIPYKIDTSSEGNKQRAGNTQGCRGLHKHKHSWSHQTNSQQSNPVKQVN